MMEFEWIARYFAPLAGEGGLGLTDDAALLTPPAGKELVLTKDAMVAGIHFFADDSPHCLAKKLLRVNLSDLAAKGATPIGYLLALMLPRHTSERWVEAFADGLDEDQEHFGIALLGGDTTRTDGPLCLSLTAIGQADAGQMIRRSGAQAGDDLYLTGTLGDAALWLALQKEDTLTLTAEETESLHKRYLLPQPRCAFGQTLPPLATAALDVSDGLLADATHLAKASSIALHIRQDAIPLSAPARAVITQHSALWQTILTGGDDYELLFTAPPPQEAALMQLAEKTGTPLHKIGTVAAGSDVTVTDANSQALSFDRLGWQHF